MEDKLQEYLNGVLDLLAEAVDRVFNDTSLYNTSYWNTFIHTLLFDISGGLVVRPGHVRSEAEVRYNLINPLLKHVVNRIAMIKAPEGCTANMFGLAVQSQVFP